MVEITFYFNVQRRETALCQLVSKALRKNHLINILTDSEAASASLDRLLWEIPNTDFLPHCAADHPLCADTPICIDHRNSLFTPRPILFNWSSQLPPQPHDYQRIIEIVDTDHTFRTEARQRFRAYQAQGLVVNSIDMVTLRNTR